MHLLVSKIPNIEKAGEQILITLYDGRSHNTLDTLRYAAFTQSLTKSKFNIASLRPTKAAAREHSFRVYHQVQQWMGIRKQTESWGWKQGPMGLQPIRTRLEAAPVELLRLVSCKCEKGCGGRCSCRKAELKCTEICSSCHGTDCTNRREIELDDNDDDCEVEFDLMSAQMDSCGRPLDSENIIATDTFGNQNEDEPDPDVSQDNSNFPGPSTSSV